MYIYIYIYIIYIYIMSLSYKPFECHAKYLYTPYLQFVTSEAELTKHYRANYAVVEQNLLYGDEYKYVTTDVFKKIIKEVGPDFCVTKEDEGMNTQYLKDQAKLHNTMMCVNEDGEPLSILVWHYESKKIYISSVCSDQENPAARGSARVLITDLIDAVRKTDEIEHIFLDSVISAIPNYKKYNFKPTGTEKYGLTEMMLDLPPKEEVKGSVYDSDTESGSSTSLPFSFSSSSEDAEEDAKVKTSKASKIKASTTKASKIKASKIKASKIKASTAKVRTRAYYEIYRNTIPIDEILKKAVERKFGRDFVSTFKKPGEKTRKKPRGKLRREQGGGKKNKKTRRRRDN